MTTASIIQKIIAFVYFTIVARHIGVEDTGIYFFVLSFTTIFVIFVDLGFSNVLIREAARAQEKMQHYIATVLSIKLLFAVFTYIIAITTIYLLGYDIVVRQLVCVSAITMLFDSLNLTLYGVFRAYGNLVYEASASVMSQLLTLVLGSIFLWLDYPLIFLMYAFLISSILNSVFATSMLYRRYKLNIKISYDRVLFRHMLPIVIPFALAGIFGRVYSYIDSVLLSKLAGNIAVGLYSVPHKIANAFQFIPLAVVAAFYPRFSEYFIHDRKKLDYAFHQGIKYLALVALPVSVGIYIIADPLVHAFFSTEYVGSILALKIFMIGLFFGFVNLFFGALFNACNRQVFQTILIAIVMVLNIILNIVLIPRYGVYGAAFASIGGAICMTLLGFFIVPRIVHLNARFLWTHAFKILLSVLIMGLAVCYTMRVAHFVVAIVVGAVVYSLMLLLSGAVKKEQIFGLFSLYTK